MRSTILELELNLLIGGTPGDDAFETMEEADPYEEQALSPKNVERIRRHFKGCVEKAAKAAGLAAHAFTTYWGPDSRVLLKGVCSGSGLTKFKTALETMTDGPDLLFAPPSPARSAFVRDVLSQIGLNKTTDSQDGRAPTRLWTQFEIQWLKA